MPFFYFEGRSERTGEQINGIREAASHTALGQDLLSEGVLLTHYELKKQPSAQSSRWLSFLSRVPTLERALFARYLSLMLRAGLDVKRALTALAEQTGNRTMKQAIGTLYQDLERGKSLSESMQTFPTIFTKLFVSFVRVGETTGRLQASLEVLATQLQKEYELKRTVRGAMLYPIVIIVAMIAVGFAMLVFVLPRLVEVFEGFKVELPLATRILIAIGKFVEAYWPYVLLAMVAALIGCWLALRLRRVKETVLQVLLSVPIIGPIMKKVSLAQFSRNLSSLLGSGIPFVEALDILRDSTTHPSYSAVLGQAEVQVRQGSLFSSILSRFPKLFPPLVQNVVKVGEETGEMDKVLAETALFFESEVDQTMKNLTAIIEPVLMVVIGLAVGALAVSVISPIYSLVNVI